MKPKIINGYVNYLMRAGKDIVKSSMSAEATEKILKKAKKTKSNEFKGYSLCADGIYYFETLPLSKEVKDNA